MMKSIIRKMNDIVTYIVCILAIAIILLNAVPYLLNMNSYVVLSGSMEPNIHTGSMAYVYKNISIEEIETGDIIAFQTDSALVTHRVVGKDDKNKVFITKGDANENVDFAPVPYDMFLGKTIFSIPYFGYLMSYINSTKGKIIIVTMVLVIFLSHYLLDNNEEDEKENELKIKNRGENKNGKDK